MASEGSSRHLMELLSGYWLSQCVYVAAKLGLADKIHHCPQTAAELAQQTQTHPQALYRLLRGLASVGVFREDQNHRFEMTELAAGLRSDVPGSQCAMAIMIGEEHYLAWSELLYSVRTGRPGFDKVMGLPIFDFLSKNPEQAKVFDAAMVSVHGRETAASLAAYDFSAYPVVMDIGGGNGSVLMAVLEKHSSVSGVLFDLPGVIERARSRVEQAGLAQRCQLVSGNFFEAIPTGADAYMMRHIIHDWTDEQCQTILLNIHRAMKPEGRLLVIESVIPPGNDPFFGKLLDLNMLVIPGGQERTVEEYRLLFANAGFELLRVVPTATEVSILECRKKQ